MQAPSPQQLVRMALDQVVSRGYANARLEVIASDHPIMGVPDGAHRLMLVSSALVLLMTPGLAFFYGGMVRLQERPT